MGGAGGAGVGGGGESGGGVGSGGAGGGRAPAARRSSRLAGAASQGGRDGGGGEPAGAEPMETEATGGAAEDEQEGDTDGDEFDSDGEEGDGEEGEEEERKAEQFCGIANVVDAHQASIIAQLGYEHPANASSTCTQIVYKVTGDAGEMGTSHGLITFVASEMKHLGILGSGDAITQQLPCAQSASQAFPLANFNGKDSTFALKRNLTPYLQQQEELDTTGGGVFSYLSRNPPVIWGDHTPGPPRPGPGADDDRRTWLVPTFAPFDGKFGDNAPTARDVVVTGVEVLTQSVLCADAAFEYTATGIGLGDARPNFYLDRTKEDLKNVFVLHVGKEQSMRDVAYELRPDSFKGGKAGESWFLRLMEVANAHEANLQCSSITRPPAMRTREQMAGSAVPRRAPVGGRRAGGRGGGRGAAGRGAGARGGAARDARLEQAVEDSVDERAGAGSETPQEYADVEFRRLQPPFVLDEFRRPIDSALFGAVDKVSCGSLRLTGCAARTD